MIIVEEHISDVLKYSEWFASMSCKRKDVSKRVVAMENIVVERMFGNKDRENALKSVTEKLSVLLKPLDTDYSLYLMVNKILINRMSKVENNKKVWKYIEEKCDIRGFTFGEELKLTFQGEEYYSSFAKIPIKDVDKALKIVSLNPERNFILISKEDKYLTASQTQKLFHQAFDSVSKKLISVDNYKLSLEIPQKEEMFIRWLDFGDEMEIGIVYDSGHICIRK